MNSLQRTFGGGDHPVSATFLAQGKDIVMPGVSEASESFFGQAEHLTKIAIGFECEKGFLDGRIIAHGNVERCEAFGPFSMVTPSFIDRDPALRLRVNLSSYLTLREALCKGRTSPSLP